MPFAADEIMPRDAAGKRTGLPLPTVALIIAQVVAALEYMRSWKCCHRDIKPANILVDHEDNYRAKISDFGLSR